MGSVTDAVLQYSSSARSEIPHERCISHNMQELHTQFANLEVTAADSFDQGRVIQALRRICVELDGLGDKVVEAKKTQHALLKSLPDEYSAFKAVLE